jgi:autotransporter translocation and assembly factor TamB
MNAAAPQRQKSAWWRVLVVLIVVVFTPGLLLVGTAWWLGTSEQGSRWLADHATRLVPALQLDFKAGSLAEGLQLHQVVWREPEWSLRAVDVQLGWRPACLLATRLCLTALTIDRLEVVSSAPPAAGPAELPEFSSPVSVAVGVFELNELVVSREGSETLVIELIKGRNVHLQDNELSFKQLQLQLLDNQLQARGELRFAPDYPLSVAVTATLQALQQPLHAQLSGTLRELHYELTEIEGVPLRITGSVAPLADGLPLQARAVALHSFKWPVGDQVFTVKALEADVSGDNQALNLQLEGLVSEPGLGDVPVLAVARWRDGHIWLDRGELQVQQYPLQVSGEVFWSDGQAPRLQNVQVTHSATADAVTTLSLQGSLADGGLEWSLAAPDLSAYLPLAGEANAQGKLTAVGAGYALTLTARADELAVGDLVGAALELRCQVQLDSMEQPVDLRCARARAMLPATNWSLASAWRLQQTPTSVLQWHQGQLTVPPICLQEQATPDLRLCLTQAFTLSGADRSELQLALGKVPLTWFDSLIPGNNSLSGDADMQLQWAASNVAEPALHWQARIAEFGNLQGSIDLVEQGALTVQGAGIDLAPLLQLYPELGQLSGTFDVDLRASSKPEGPWVTGMASIHDARLGIVGQTGLFASSLLQLDLQGQQAQLQGQVAAEGGPAQLTGSIDWRMPQWQAQIRLMAESLAIAPLPGVTLQLVPDLTLSASPQSTHLEGDIFVPSGLIDLSHISGSPQVVSVSADTQIVGEQSREDTGAPFSAAITVRLGDAVRFQGYGLIGQLFGSVLLEKPAGGRLQARGSVGIADGHWRAYGQDLLVEQGRLEFNGPLDEPYLRLRAERRQSAGGATVGVLVDGPLDDPRIQLFSSEAMSEQERMHYLITGRRMDAAGTSTDGAAAQAAVAVGLAGANSQLGKAAEQLGIQGFALGTEMGERGQEAQVSGYFGPNLYLKYGYSMFEPGTAFSARYRLTERFYIEGYQSTSSALNLLWYIRRQNDAVAEPLADQVAE